MKIKPPSCDLVEYLHTRAIADPYRPLENLTAKETLSWVDAQTQNTEAKVFDPAKVQAFVARVSEAFKSYPTQSLPVRCGDRTMALVNSGLQPHDVLMVKSKDEEPAVLLDPNTWPSEDGISLIGSSPSPDGKYLAYQTNENGGDWSKLQVMDIGTRKIIADEFRPCRHCRISWTSDSKSFVYSSPTSSVPIVNEGGDPQFKIFKHIIGTSGSDDLIYYDLAPSGLGHEKRRVRPEISFHPETGDEFIFDSGDRGDGYALYWRNSKGELVELLRRDDQAIFNFADGGDGHFYGVTTLGAPRGRVVRVDKLNPQQKHWTTLVPEHERDVQAEFILLGDKLLVTWKRDVSDFIAVYSKEGKHVSELDLPPMVSLEVSAEHWTDRWAYISVASYRSPSLRYTYDADSGVLTLCGKAEIVRDLTGDSIVVEQAFATSKDGTRVPMSIIYDADKVKLDGTAATQMYGYGGFGTGSYPYFARSIMLWVENGGVFVETNIRGGDEYGRDWHHAARGRKKQNCFDDFIACAQYLIENRYTTPERLGSYGGSNGGLLVLACALQRPDLFGAVLADVPVTDMLRFHKSASGPDWLTEFGNPDNEADFENLLTFSPLHNVKKDQLYPAMLLATGSDDERAMPWHAFKFVATMQEVSPETLCYLQVYSDAGHEGGIGLDKRIENTGRNYSFWEFALGPISQAEYRLWKGSRGEPVTTLKQ